MTEWQIDGEMSVIKVGGSLLDWPELPSRLATWLADDDRAARPPRRTLLLAGGGPIADVIRSMDRIHGLGQGRSHDLAIRAMDVTAALLAALLPGTRLVSRRDEIEAAWGEHLTPILAPRRLLEEFDARSASPLPASWDVTSDSIAARVACLLGAGRLVLLKSARTDGIASLDEAARTGLVDGYFRIAAAPLARVELVGLRETPRTLLRLDRMFAEDSAEARPARELDAGSVGDQNPWMAARITAGRWTVPRPSTMRKGDPSAGSGLLSPRRMALSLVSIDHPEVPPLAISNRLRSQIVYFMTPPETPGVPPLREDEYWIARDDVTHWLMEGVFLLVSPLDTENMTEVELTEEQEGLLSWLDRHHVQHVRVLGE